MIQLPAPLVSTLDRWFDAAPPVSPSISYAVFDREGVLYHRGVGEFQLDGRVPTVDTVYRIASMSKSFLAAAVLVLCERGLLSLDDAVSAHVPEFRDPVDRFGVTIPVTVKMALDNSSGLPEDNGWADHELALTRAEFLAVVAAGLGFADLPGVGYQYSNVAFWLLGVIVENVSGREFVDFATEALLEPLGLAHTRYAADEYPEGTAIAHGFGTFDEGASWFDRPFVAGGIGACAASMYSTPGDIARWSAWLSSAFDTQNRDDSVLSRQSRRAMQRIHTPLPSPADRALPQQLEAAGYALGLVVEHDTRFGAIAQHSGGLPGFSSNMRWHLETGLGVVVFANTNGVRPAAPAAGMLRAVLEAVEAPARTIELWPATVEAAVEVERSLVTTGSVLGAGRLFSPNLLSDVPASVRDARWEKAVADVGGLAAASRALPVTERLAWTVSAAHVAFTIPGETGELECTLELTPTTPAMIQRLDVVVRKPLTEQSPVARHYRPVMPPSAG
jgi:CubicO group peptidase (beta-lactamase class C family)